MYIYRCIFNMYWQQAFIRGSSPEIVPPFFLFWREPLFFWHRKSPKTQPTSNRPATNRHLFFDNNELTLPHHRKFICLFPAAMVDDVKIWRSSRHVESLSTWRDDRLLLFFLSCCSVTCLKKICCVIRGRLYVHPMNRYVFAGIKTYVFLRRIFTQT